MGSLKIGCQVRIVGDAIEVIGQVDGDFEALHGQWKDMAVLESAEILVKDEDILLTLTTKVSFKRSSIVLPSRLRFLPPCNSPSIELRDLFDSGVKIPPPA